MRAPWGYFQKDIRFLEVFAGGTLFGPFGKPCGLLPFSWKAPWGNLRITSGVPYVSAEGLNRETNGKPLVFHRFSLGGSWGETFGKQWDLFMFSLRAPWGDPKETIQFPQVFAEGPLGGDPKKTN